MTESLDSKVMKLPRIGGPKKPSRQSTMHSMPSPPASHAQLQPLEERRRFINVVRPLSVFPEPALPPNYIPPVLSQQRTSFNDRYHDYSSLVTQPVRGRPPSPAPFNRQQPRSQQQRMAGSNSNFSLSGQGVGGYGDHTSGSAALRVNLAGGSGWDLTAIKRGYNTVGNYGASKAPYNNSYKSL